MVAGSLGKGKAYAKEHKICKSNANPKYGKSKNKKLLLVFFLQTK